MNHTFELDPELIDKYSVFVDGTKVWIDYFF